VAASNATIPFNWFGSVAVGREPIFESAICKALLQVRLEKILERKIDSSFGKLVFTLLKVSLLNNV
jgi:hypothetical protein